MIKKDMDETNQGFMRHLGGLDLKKIDDKIVDLSTKVVVELFKTLWQRKGFWESAIKNVR